MIEAVLLLISILIDIFEMLWRLIVLLAKGALETWDLVIGNSSNTTRPPN
jgi:hypothetical protein